MYNLRYKKLDPFDIDFMLFNRSDEHIGFAEVKGKKRGSVDTAEVLILSVNKASKLQSKRLNPIIIWALDDGIIFAKLNRLIGTVMYGGREPREGAYNDNELIIKYKRQDAMVYERY